MRILVLLGILLLSVALLFLVRLLAGIMVSNRVRRAKWRRFEFVDGEGKTHVVLRRSIWLRGREILADPDQEVDVIDDEDPEHDFHLAQARLVADQRVDQTNYRLPS